MERNILKKAVVLNISLAAIALLFERKIAIGFLLGCFFFVIYFQLLNREMDILLIELKSSALTKSLKFMRILVLITPLVISYYYSDYVSVYSVSAALVDFKLFIFLSVLKKKGG